MQLCIQYTVSVLYTCTALNLETIRSDIDFELQT